MTIEPATTQEPTMTMITIPRDENGVRIEKASAPSAVLSPVERETIYAALRAHDRAPIR